MPSKSLKLFWLKSLKKILLCSFVFAASPAFAISISPIFPWSAVPVGSADPTAYYLAGTYAGVIAPTFKKFDFTVTNSDSDIVLNIGGANTSLGVTWIMAEHKTNPTTYYPVPLRGCGAGTINTPDVGQCNSALIGDFQIAINLNDICQNATDYLNIRGCDGHNVAQTNALASYGFRFRVLNNAVGTGIPTNGSTGALLAIYPQTAAPTIRTNTCVEAPGFFPGDGVILVDTNLPQGVAATTGGSTQFPTFLTFAEPSDGTISAAAPFSSRIAVGNPKGSGQAEISGFVNQTKDADPEKFYGLRFGIQDTAGAVTLCPSQFTRVFSTDIQGFLQESNCFIATASYRDGRAPGVMLLREFRDEILTNSKFGRSFIGWYYEHGPSAADWLIEHSFLRGIFLTFLLPLQALAWVALHPAVLLLPFALLMGILFSLVRKKKKIGSSIALFIALSALGLTAAPSVRASDQPYIDSLVSELPKESYTPSPGNESPYINSIKKSAGNPDEANSYSDSLKKEIPARDGSEGYSERLQKRLPKVTGSAIEDYRNGKQLKANKGSMETRSAFGFQILASANRTYTAGANQDVPFEDVYGNSWIPDFNLHYEYRPFTSDFLKKLGLYGSIGAGFTKAQGIFNYQGQFEPQSRTQFTFVSIPVNLGLMYRVNAFNFLYPFFGAGPSVIGFIENRNDNKGGKHGYTFGYWFQGGVSFGLDWLSSKNSWEQYESNGVKHSYLSIGYSRLESVSGGLVEFTVDGIDVGFTFEL